MPKQYENQEGLLVLPGTNQCAGYIFNFTGYGAYFIDEAPLTLAVALAPWVGLLWMMY